MNSDTHSTLRTNEQKLRHRPLERKAWLVLLLVPALLIFAAGAASASRAAGSPEKSKAIQLPADNAMHPSAHTEWWYIVGHLTDGSHHRLGFETTLFKFSNVQIPGSKSTISVDKVDVALTDVHGKAFTHSITYVEPGLDPVNLQTKHFSEQMGADRVWSVGKDIDVSSNSGATRVRLALLPVRKAILEGGTGIVPMGKNGYSYYYSYPKLSISGRVFYRGHWRQVSGEAWMDHQWGSWSWTNVKGWTWGAIQLANGIDFSISNFRTIGTSLHGVTASYPKGHQQTFATVRIVPTAYWYSAATKTRYGSGWKVTIPGLAAKLTVTPLLKDQFMYDSTEPPASYWEGDCSVTGTFKGQTIRGQAYMELVGGSRRFGVL